MLAQLLTILAASWLVLSGCANTTQTAQANPDSVLRKRQDHSEVHGEVGLMYGQSAR